MIPLNPWEHQNAIKTLYARCVGPVCAKHQISRIELDILLFLANNPCFDTATDIVEVRYLSKSQVSAALKTLEEQGYIEKECTGNNRKTRHLRISGRAAPIIEDGRQAQESFTAIMLEGLTEDEVECMRRCFDRMYQNIDGFIYGNHCDMQEV